MMKRLFSLLLCLLMVTVSICSCASEEESARQLTPEEMAAKEAEEEAAKGAVIDLYLTDLIYDFDPANAYNNEAALKIISLMYEPLFYLDDNGKIKSNLVEKYTIEEDEEKGEYKMSLHLADTYWSDGTYVSANDVVYSWKRVLETEASYAAACLLFDIKNARAANEGNTSIDSIGLSAPNDKLVEVFFEGPIDYNQFLLNLTSYALAPLRENLATKSSFYEIDLGTDPVTGQEVVKIVRKYNDWAKQGGTMAASGPFKLRTIEYPDDPIKSSNGTYLKNENGELLYYCYAKDCTDPNGVSTVKLEKGIYWYMGEDGVKYAYPDDYLTKHPDKAIEIATTCNQVLGQISDYATSPQNDPQIILERNSYYFKDVENENWKVDAEVTPYRLVVNYALDDQEIMDAYNAGKIFYVGNIPLSVRSEYKDQATVTDALSTHAYYLNENAVVSYSWVTYNDDGTPILFDKVGTQYVFDPETGAIVYGDALGNSYTYVGEVDENGKLIYYTEDGTKVYTGEDGLPILGEKILTNVSLRNALSLAIDREAIASAVVFAEAANALVPSGVFDSNSAKKTFRENGAAYIATTADLAAAQAKLAESGVDPSKYALELSYAEYDEVHAMIATTVAASWEALGFEVRLNKLGVFENTDIWTTTQEVLSGVKDDMWLESLVSGDYVIMAMDMVAYSADPFSVLAPFAKLFSGMGMDMQNFDEYGEPVYEAAPHITGFDDETYNQMIEEIYAEKDIEARSAKLHEAEAYLMAQMPIIPIIYNQDAILVNDDMLTDYEGNYYAPAGFIDCYLKGTPQYDTHIKTIWITIAIVATVVIVVAAVTFFTVSYRIKAKKREEEIARISAEHEAKLREIRRPGSRT